MDGYIYFYVPQLCYPKIFKIGRSAYPCLRQSYYTQDPFAKPVCILGCYKYSSILTEHMIHQIASLKWIPNFEHYIPEHGRGKEFFLVGDLSKVISWLKDWLKLSEVPEEFHQHQKDEDYIPLQIPHVGFDVDHNIPNMECCAELFKEDYVEISTKGFFSSLGYSLRDYQWEAIKRIKETISIKGKGILKLATGLGKSFLILSTIIFSKSPVLYLTYQHNIADTQEILKNCSFVKYLKSGEVPDGKHKLYVTLRQSFNERWENFEGLIYDEVHHDFNENTETSRKVANFKVDWRLGFSATPFNGVSSHDDNIKELFGNVIYQYSYFQGVPDYLTPLKFVFHHHDEKLIDIIEKDETPNKKGLIWLNKTELAREEYVSLKDALVFSGVTPYLSTSEIKDCQEIDEKFNKSEKNCFMFTAQKFQVGYNDKHLSFVIADLPNVMKGSSANMVIQRAGRLTRKDTSKPNGVFHLIHSEGDPVFTIVDFLARNFTDIYENEIEEVKVVNIKDGKCYVNDKYVFDVDLSHFPELSHEELTRKVNERVNEIRKPRNVKKLIEQVRRYGITSKASYRQNYERFSLPNMEETRQILREEKKRWWHVFHTEEKAKNYVPFESFKRICNDEEFGCEKDHLAYCLTNVKFPPPEILEDELYQEDPIYGTFYQGLRSK